MVSMPQAMTIMIFAVAVAVIFFWVKVVKNSNQRKRMVRDTSATNAWQSAEQIGDLITFYLDMVLKHGPDSLEAKAFKFGVDEDKPGTGRIWHNRGSMEAFYNVTKHFDDALRRHRKMFRWSKRQTGEGQ